MKIIECIPNFSEGRDQSTILAIRDAICSVPDIQFLLLESGEETHRTVMTFTGSPEAVSEAAFRAIESEVIRELSPRTGLVIATGGGAILDPENVRRLKRNGLLCFIRRDPERLSPTPDRPLSSDSAAMRALYQRRKEAYRRATELVIDNDGSLEDSLKQLEALV